MAHSKELDKSIMAVAGVVLGLPTMMISIGSNTVESGLIAIRRPVLALILSAASPSINPLRTLEYRSPTELLKTRADALGAPRLQGWPMILVSMCEYFLGLLAVGNIVHNTWELSHSTVFALGPESGFQAGLWLGLAVVAHVIGMGTLMLRVRFKQRESTGSSWIASWIRMEITPCASQPGGELRYRWGKESVCFLFFSWFALVGTVMFIIYGSCMFASVMFISMRDAIGVAVRYLASVVVCRIVLAYELSGLRQVTDVPGEDEKLGNDVEELSTVQSTSYEALQTGPNKTYPV